MARSTKKDELVIDLCDRMHTDVETVEEWLDGIVEVLFERFKRGESITIRGLGRFYVRPEPDSWVFKFNPGQRLWALLGWSSTYKTK